MKGFGIFAAVAASIVVLTPAPASAYRGTTAGLSPIAELAGSQNLDRDRRDWNRDRRDWDRGRGWDRGRHRGWERNRRWKWRTVCNTQWRNGYRERVCRRVRYR